MMFVTFSHPSYAFYVFKIILFDYLCSAICNIIIDFLCCKLTNKLIINIFITIGLVTKAVPVGTPEYIAPEVLQCLQNVSFKLIPILSKNT